jgi:hypothetical protein
MRAFSATFVLSLALVSAAIGCKASTPSTAGQAGGGSQAQAGSTAWSGSGASGYGGGAATAQAGTTGTAAVGGNVGSAGSQGQAGSGTAAVDAGAPAPAACDGYDAASTLTTCFVGDCKDQIRNNTDVATCVTACFNKTGAPSACSTCAGGAAATTRAVNCMSLCDTGAPGCTSCMTGQDFTSNLPTCGVNKTDMVYTQKDGACGSPDDQKKIANLLSINMICTTTQCNTDFLAGDPTTCMSTCYRDANHFNDACTACLGSKTLPAKNACTTTCITSPPTCLSGCIYPKLSETQPECVGK